MDYVRLGAYADVITESADLILTSPPYNIGSPGGPRRDGKRKYGLFDPKSFGGITGYDDNMPEEMYQKFQGDFLLWAADHLNDGGILVYNHKPRRKNGEMIFPHEWFLTPSVREVLTPMEEIIWNRGSTHNHSNKLMWPTTERLYVFRKKGDPYSFVNHGDMPQRSDLWKITNITRRPEHNAPFPIDLAEAVIAAFSKPGQVVMDPYSGSGTTGAAAISMRRDFIGAEIEPKYQEIGNKRVVAVANGIAAATNAAVAS